MHRGWLVYLTLGCIIIGTGLNNRGITAEMEIRKTLGSTLGTQKPTTDEPVRRSPVQAPQSLDDRWPGTRIK
jgi:hypothetical protein